MSANQKQIVFANPKLEEDYSRLQSSTNSEDKKLYRTLSKVKSKLSSQHAAGVQIPKTKIPQVYKAAFHVQKLWRLRISKTETIYYDYLETQIRIIDIV